MKSLKMILSAAAIFAVVGASLAFSPAKKFSNLCLYTIDTETGLCPFVDFVNAGNQFAIPTSRTLANDGNCPTAIPATLCNQTVFINAQQ